MLLHAGGSQYKVPVVSEIYDPLSILEIDYQNQPPVGVLSKRCSENMQQIYRRTSILKSDFNKVAKQMQSKANFCMGVLL